MRAGGVIAVALIMVTSLFVVARGYQDCEAAGGAYVKGAVWYECVAKVTP